jgi:hypothetical protein
MKSRLALGVLFLVLAVAEFVHAGPAAAAVVGRPGELIEAVLAGDGIGGPWLLLAYGILMLVRARSVATD